MAIPVEPSDAEFNRYIDNILYAYHVSTASQRERGMHWYETARDVAVMIAGDASTGAGVIAALSARTSWGDNVKRATEAFATGGPKGHTKANLDKVRRIMNGENPTDVLPMGLKTGHFYRCIADPGNNESVVIDRHAHDVAVGERWSDGNLGLSNKKRYDTLANAYRKAAALIGVRPSQLQAMVWCHQVDNFQYKRRQG